VRVRGRSAAASRRTLLAVILLTVAAAYGSGLSSGFVWDDASLVVNRAAFFANPSNALTILDSEDSAHTSGPRNPYYRPLSTLSYMLDYHLWGHDPFWYHLENLLLHAAAVVLLFLLLDAVFADRVLALIAALLFALYPVNCEAVNFISARNNLLCTGLVFASLLASWRSRTGGPPWAFGALMLFFLSLMSKEPAVVLPLLLASITLTTGEPKLRANPSLLAGFFAVLLAYFGIRFAVLGAFTSEAGPEPSLERLRLIAAVYFENFRLILLPFPLNAHYTQQFLAFGWLKAIAALVGIGSLVFFSVWRGSPEPVRIGSQWMFWGLLPVSNLVAIPSAPVAERYLYVVVPGSALVAAYLLRQWLRRNAPVAAIAIAIIAAAFGIRTHTRTGVWTDDLSLDTSMVRADPSNPLAHLNLGISLSGAGRLEEAEGELRESIRLSPSEPRAHYNLAVLLYQQNRLLEAVKVNEAAVRLDPEHPKARSSLGMIYLGLARPEDAGPELEAAVRLGPDDAEVRNNLGMFYGEAGRLQEALAEFQAAARLRPDLPAVQRNLGIVYMKLGRTAEAQEALEEAARLERRTTLAPP